MTISTPLTKRPRIGYRAGWRKIVAAVYDRRAKLGFAIVGGHRPPLQEERFPTDANRSRAFTLVEVMIAAAVSGVVLAGVLGAFLFIARTGLRASGYSEMEAEIRRGLETFARDARNATDVRWHSAQSLTLTVNGAPVTYAYDTASTGATARAFYRLAGEADSTQARTVLIRGVASDFQFLRFKYATAGGDHPALNDRETRQLQLSLQTTRSSTATAGAGQTLLSARYLLRNKRANP